MGFRDAIRQGDYEFTFELPDNEAFAKMYLPYDLDTGYLITKATVGDVFTYVNSVGYLISKTITLPSGKTIFMGMQYIPILTFPPVIGTSDLMSVNFYSFGLPVSGKRIDIVSYANAPISILWFLASFLPIDYSALSLSIFGDDGSTEKVNTIIPAVAMIKIRNYTYNILEVIDSLSYLANGVKIIGGVYLFAPDSSFSVAHLIRGIRGDFASGNVDNYWYISERSYNDSMQFDYRTFGKTRVSEGAQIQKIDSFLSQKEFVRTPIWFSHYKEGIHITIVGEMHYEDILSISSPSLTLNLLRESGMPEHIIKEMQKNGVSATQYKQVLPIVKTLVSSLVNKGSVYFWTSPFLWYASMMDYPFRGVLSLSGSTMLPDTPYPVTYILPATSRKLVTYQVEGVAFEDVAREYQTKILPSLTG